MDLRREALRRVVNRYTDFFARWRAGAPQAVGHASEIV
jgi:hypothetical protein